MKAIGIGFVKHASVFRGDGIFIAIVFFYSVNLGLPYAGRNLVHAVDMFVPIVEVAHNGNLNGIGCPNAKCKSILFNFMSAEEFICSVIFTFIKR